MESSFKKWFGILVVPKKRLEKNLAQFFSKFEGPKKHTKSHAPTKLELWESTKGVPEEEVPKINPSKLQVGPLPTRTTRHPSELQWVFGWRICQLGPAKVGSSADMSFTPKQPMSM